MHEQYIKAFFRYALNRENIRLLKLKGEPKPWTQDDILQSFRFCNINREDDVVTKWIRERITFARYGDRLLGALIIARWFNRITTLEKMYWDKERFGQMAYDDVFHFWADNMDAWEDIMRSTLSGTKPLVTAAYMIKTPAGMNKLDGLISIMKGILPDAQHLQLHIDEDVALEDFVSVISEYPYFGPFYSYEIACDMYQTEGSPLANAPDIMTWANPGPGAARGLARLWGLDLKHWNRNNKAHIEHMNQYMRDILAASKDANNWPVSWKPWDMRTVEHTLCEFDKYERVRLGQGRPKQRYQGK